MIVGYYDGDSVSGICHAVLQALSAKLFVPAECRTGTSTLLLP
ncbi:hypothetical protein I546_6807 [Mycobacterium kansasii 732]|nr:hypothetical protein I546_6807 [Mycobacterium kansasii 732]